MQTERAQYQYPQSQYPQPRYPQNQYPQQHTLNPGQVEILDAKDKEEDLDMEEAKLYVIIVGN